MYHREWKLVLKWGGGYGLGGGGGAGSFTCKLQILFSWMKRHEGGWGGRRWGRRGEESWEQVMGRSEAVMPPVYME